MRLPGAGQRFPRDDETIIGFGESEERINQEEQWPVGKEDIRLSPVEGKAGTKTNMDVI